ncbi:hypothetical protein ACWGF3_36435 [Streptomyces xanthophaeus]|uniref:hypothetical protein n=1 Tax=Streptomyces xanthophaeus TaxID=67385 RepID=UPI0004CCC0C7|nr:hypothetical protein [Streptomyces xanthophaeus]WST23157.1 hypothetical protein OG264_17650 [Streptomyces xanthophaeus]WST61867.1 hypothetical protein OG605_20785 [Streptomyces xanthophaeus]
MAADLNTLAITDASLARPHGEACCDCGGAVRTVPAPSRDLLERARAGWERFIDSVEMPSDD